MTALFDRPHPAHRRDESVMWFGVTIDDFQKEFLAIYANKHGSLQTCPLREVVADVRYVEDLGKYPALGRSGPGWLDLEDMAEATPDAVVNLGEMTPEKLEELKPTLAQEAAKALIEGKDYITDREGHKYDVTTLKEIVDE